MDDEVGKYTYRRRPDKEDDGCTALASVVTVDVTVRTAMALKKDETCRLAGSRLGIHVDANANVDAEAKAKTDAADGTNKQTDRQTGSRHACA